MPINHRRGPCRFCGKPVGKGKGFAERSPRTGIWLAWHPVCDPIPTAHVRGRGGKFNRRPPDAPPPYYLDVDE